MFSRSDIDEVVAMDAQPAVSLYLPTHIARCEIRQDPIRLKDPLFVVADRLAATWGRPEDACAAAVDRLNALLRPARRQPNPTRS
jgi:hypothetical protein